jgi:Domain of unknown function (DUF4292)
VVRLNYGALSLCGLLLLLVGCQRAVGPGTVPPEERLSTAEPIWQHLADRRAAFQTLKGLAEARIASPAQNVSLDTVALVLQRFEAMRLEGIGALGQPVFLLVAEKGRFAFYAPREARLLTGTASAYNLERVFGISLAPQALQAILIGDLPLATLPTGGPVTYRARRNLYIWEGQDPQREGTYRVWFEATHLQPVRFELEDLLGRVVLRVQYEDFQQLPGFWFPYRITVDQPLAKQQVSWHYSEVQLDVRLTPTVFQIRVPAGTERVELE